MSFKLSGLNGLPYLGVEATTPPQLLYVQRAPTANDYRNINVGTLWLYVGQPGNTPIQLFMAATVVPGDAEWINLYPGSGGVGEFITDAGTAIPVAGVINDLGDGNVIQTTGAGNTITTSLLNGTNGQVLIGGGAAPTWKTITEGANITIVNGANSITIASTASGAATDFVTQAGTAHPIAGIINVLGTNVVTTSAPLSAETIDIGLTQGMNGQVIIGATGNAPAWATMTSDDGTVKFTPGANTLDLSAPGSGGGGRGGGVLVSVFTSSGTWTPNANTATATIYGIGGGAGGGSGQQGLPNASSGGGGGGPSFPKLLATLIKPFLSVPISFTVGMGGAGGASVVTANTAGNNGQVGGNTTLGTIGTVIAPGGNPAGGGGAPQLGASGIVGFVNTSGAKPVYPVGAPGQPPSLRPTPSSSGFGTPFFVASLNTGTSMGNAGTNYTLINTISGPAANFYPGTGIFYSDGEYTVGTGAFVPAYGDPSGNAIMQDFGLACGGGGGSGYAAPTPYAGGTGGTYAGVAAAAGGLEGSADINGADGLSYTTVSTDLGNGAWVWGQGGGGGGGQSIGPVAGNGGNGGQGGGGGGGGGGSGNGTDSGAGGNGGGGLIIIYEYLSVGAPAGACFSTTLTTQYLVPYLNPQAITGIQYQIVPMDTVLFDVTSSYNTGTGLFTAPTTGKYMFNIVLGVLSYTGANASPKWIAAMLQTTGGNYTGFGSPTSSNTSFTGFYGPYNDGANYVSLSIEVPMTSGDIAAPYLVSQSNANNGGYCAQIQGQQTVTAKPSNLTLYSTTFSGYFLGV